MWVSIAKTSYFEGHFFDSSYRGHFQQLKSSSNQIDKITRSIFVLICPVQVSIIPGQTSTEKLHNAWIRLQTSVNGIVDSALDKVSTNKHPGIKQVRSRQLMIGQLECDETPCGQMQGKG